MFSPEGNRWILILYFNSQLYSSMPLNWIVGHVCSGLNAIYLTNFQLIWSRNIARLDKDILG